MEKSIGYLCGLAAGLILGAVVLMVRKKKQNSPCSFDERQELIRGKAFRMGFIVLMAFEVIAAGAAPLIVKGGYLAMEDIFLLGVVLGIAVFAAYAIWHDAYFTVQDNPRQWVFLFVGVGMLNLIGAIRGFHEEGGGILGKNPLSVAFCAVMILLVAEILVKQAKNRRSGEWE